MKRFRKYVLVVLSFLLPLSMRAQTQAAPLSGHTAAKAAEAQPPAFDPSTPFASRITASPDTVMRNFHAAPGLTPIVHAPSEAERAKVMDVLQQLPLFAQQAFREHVRTISFLDGIAGNGVTILEAGSTTPVFDVVVRGSILDESMSDFLTRKERTGYTATDSGETVSVEAGSLPALLYILLHESVHVIDISNRHGQEGPPRLIKADTPSQLVQGIWDNATAPKAAYRSPLLEDSWFRTRKPVSMDKAEATYQMLARTPFVSLYASSNWYDDLAELVTCYYLTQRLKQPYRIVLVRGSETLYSLTPMSSELVQARFPGILPLFG